MPPKAKPTKDSSSATTRRLAVMNLALRGIEADFGPEHADTFPRDLHPDLRADTATRVSAKPKSRSHLAGLLRSERQLLANPPFNDSDWFRKDDDVRWQFGVLPKGNANFAWVQHFIRTKFNSFATLRDALLPKLLSGELSVTQTQN